MADTHHETKVTGHLARCEWPLLISLATVGLFLAFGTRAALANELQRSVNILLGRALATIGLTIPLCS